MASESTLNAETNSSLKLLEDLNLDPYDKITAAMISQQLFNFGTLITGNLIQHGKLAAANEFSVLHAGLALCLKMSVASAEEAKAKFAARN